MDEKLFKLIEIVFIGGALIVVITWAVSLGRLSRWGQSARLSRDRLI
jgi:hypothetical protein